MNKKDWSKEIRITSHKDKNLKDVYDFIFGLLKTIKSYPVKEYNQKEYYQMIDSNPYPEFIKRQMKKLIHKKIATLKHTEFRLIVPRSKISYCGNLYIPQGFYLKHLYFDSRSLFMTISRKSKNGHVKHLDLSEAVVAPNNPILSEV